MTQYEELIEYLEGKEVPVFGKNENCENVIYTTDGEHVVVRTYQNNGWIRKNIYHKDGTVEEIFEK